MANLGEFGAALRELDPDGERDHFLFFGEKFVLVADVSGITEMQLAAGLTGSVGEDDAASAMWDALLEALGAEQFEKFKLLAREKRADLQSIMGLVFRIMAAPTGRPTERRSTSGDGPPATSPSSSTSSSHPALAHLRPVSDLLDGSAESAAG